MENQQNPNIALINSFIEITSCSQSEANFFLESHNFDLDSAVSTFLETDENHHPPATATNIANVERGAGQEGDGDDDDEEYEEGEGEEEDDDEDVILERSRSASPRRGEPYSLRSGRREAGSGGGGRIIGEESGGRSGGVASGGGRGNVAGSGGGGGRRSGGGGGGGRIRMFADLNKKASGGGEGSDSDPDYEPDAPEYYTGGEKSGMVVQDRAKASDGDAIFNAIRNSGAVDASGEHSRPSSSSRSFRGTARLLSGDTVVPAPQQSEERNHHITLWNNGFTVNDGPLRRNDDLQNAPFLESIQRGECPDELRSSAKRSGGIKVSLERKPENYPISAARQPTSFLGVGRTLTTSSSNITSTTEPSAPAANSIAASPSPIMGLVVDQALPTTSIQLRLADGTRMVSRFNFHHTINDIRGFIDASRPGGSSSYQLQTVGFPPKQLTELGQTIEQAGLANSVVIQKLG